ncbi:MAG: tetratricopeptide repeat protein [Gemmataceae bacterium]|nr:tetratricopeptide repeat protein [Gemmataceae bacterium]
MQTEPTSPAAEEKPESLPPAGGGVPPPAAPASPRPALPKRLLLPLLRLPRWVRAHPSAAAVLAASLLLLGLGVKLLGMQLWAGYHLRAARTSLERFHTEQAVHHLQNCLQVWPTDPDVLLPAARAARRLGDYEKAAVLLERCAGSPRHADEVSLEHLLLRAARGETDQVQRLCRALIEKDDPATPLVFEALVSGYLTTYRRYEAFACLQEWLKRQPDHAQALFLRGALYLQMQARQEALETWNRVVQLDPDHDAARMALTGLLLELKRPADALTHARYLSQRLPHNPAVKLRLGAALAELHQREEAEQVLDEALAGHPDHAGILTERGKLALRAGQAELAETLLRRASEIAADYTTHYQLYLCLNQLGKTAEAKEVLGHMQRSEKALERIRELAGDRIPRAPRDPALLQEMGVLLLQTGAADEGVRWLERALAVAPDHSPTHAALAEYYRRVGQLGRAARHRELARAGAPGSPGPSP